MKYKGYIPILIIYYPLCFTGCSYIITFHINKFQKLGIIMYELKAEY